ncbi:polysaccharide pyruvyl transferase family protein [Streptomyces caatingaensis]|uniref:polysaccharide pyruvyl transferase family protein n=1 Tax=Streptomyces caatingaensis TaxID=1678637 RepID=UPI000B1D26EC|nr:polysaccharide pyruvyl transferase family protein [Streptomyces caatingaensis]
MGGTGPRPGRVLVTGWFSFVHGEATAGDVLAAEHVCGALAAAGIGHDVAWSPVLRPAGPVLDGLDPAAYSHLVFVCGPLHGAPAGDGLPSPLLELHRRFAHARRVAVGVSVPDPDDPAVTAFHRVLARDGAGHAPPSADLSCHAPEPEQLPVVGVLLTSGQGEYGGRRRHDAVNAVLGGWLCHAPAARVPLETRLDGRDWRLPATAAQLWSVLRRLDGVVTTRLHGLVLGLRAGLPVLAVDPVEGGAKVGAQARALGWPAVVPAGRLTEAELDRWWTWCRSEPGRARAARIRDRMRGGGYDDPVGDLVAALTGELPREGREGRDGCDGRGGRGR